MELVIKLSAEAALRVYDGRGSIRQVDADADAGILLLERVRPGTTPADLEDDEAATAIAADLMRQLRSSIRFRPSSDGADRCSACTVASAGAPALPRSTWFRWPSR